MLKGRGGKGSIFTFSSGNSNAQSEDVNSQEIKSSIYTVTIGSISPNATPAYYTTPGAAVLASTYGGDLRDFPVGIVSLLLSDCGKYIYFFTNFYFVYWKSDLKYYLGHILFN